MEITCSEAINRALREEMERDGRVYILGEDVAQGGAFGVTRHLAERFGAHRVRNTPISEGAIVGTAVGAAIVGLRPVVEVMFIDFITLAMDQIVNQAAKLRYMSGGQFTIPCVIRTALGATGGAGAQHSQSTEAWFMHVPGIKVVAPADPAEAYGLLKAAIRDDNPVLFLEHKGLYAARGTLPEAAAPLPLGTARVARAGADVTLISYSRAVRDALDAAHRLEQEGISAEVIDLRTLVPLDLAALVRSVSKTHAAAIVHEGVRHGGAGAEIAAQLSEAAFDELDAPVIRIGAGFAPLPVAPTLERALLPSVEGICAAVRTLR